MTTAEKKRDTRKTDNQTETRSQDLRESPTMARLLEALARGKDIGHNGQFVFVTAARHFMDAKEIVDLLSRQPDMDEEKARAFVQQLTERGYNPPRRERILEMQAHQKYQIIENPGDPDSGNLYRELRFPDEVYEDINEYYEEKVEAEAA
jgi:hypothetical protein